MNTNEVTPAPERFATEKQMAEMLGMSRASLCRQRAIGSGPPWIRIGIGRGQIRYPVTAFADWVAKRTQAQASAA